MQRSPTVGWRVARWTIGGAATPLRDRRTSLDGLARNAASLARCRLRPFGPSIRRFDRTARAWPSDDLSRLRSPHEHKDSSVTHESSCWGVWRPVRYRVSILAWQAESVAEMQMDLEHQIPRRRAAWRILPQRCFGWGANPDGGCAH